MKLLYLHDQYYDDRKANLIQVISMCDAFSELNIDVTLALPDSGMPAHAIKEQFKSKFKIGNSFHIALIPTYFKHTRFGRYVSYYFAHRTIQKFKPDICYIRTPPLIKKCIKSGIDTIFESHTVRLHNRIGFLNKLWHKTILNYSMRSNFIKVITISDALKMHWISCGVDKKKVLSLHDGFNTSMFDKMLQQSDARGVLKLPLKKKIVVYTGSLYADRGIETILNLAEKLRHAEFIAVGGTENNKTYYTSMAERQGVRNITFTGKVDHQQIPLYLYAADVLLAIWSEKVPTINFCSPLKIFEYMAAGRIIVAHGFPTIREVLTHETTALLADPFSFEDLTKKMKQALAMDYPSPMASEARHLAFSRYSWHTRANAIFSEVAAYHNPSSAISAQE